MVSHQTAQEPTEVSWHTTQCKFRVSNDNNVEMVTSTCAARTALSRLRPLYPVACHSGCGLSADRLGLGFWLRAAGLPTRQQLPHHVHSRPGGHLVDGDLQRDGECCFHRPGLADENVGSGAGGDGTRS